VKRFLPIVLWIIVPCVLAGCSNAPSGVAANNVSVQSSPASLSTAPAALPQQSAPAKSASPVSRAGLTTSNVERAILSMLDDYRIGGGIRVEGIQEQNAQNAAVADLRFEAFEYPTTFEGNLIPKKNFKPKAMPRDKSRLPSPEEMFPPRKAVYSKDGKAILARYTDGRWVLKEVRWGFDKSVRGSVELR
jgi:hypothetical protein